MSYKSLRNIVLILILISWTNILQATGTIELRKICKNGPNNELSWTNPTNFCDGFICIYVFYRESGTASPWVKLDSVISITDRYTHLGANLGAGASKVWEYYLTMYYYCNGGTNTLNSVTMIADEIPPDPTILDSVSVDPETNRIYLGWEPNTTPDFAYYSIYCYNLTIYPNFALTNDLYCIDTTTGIDPTKSSVKYEITASDSCGNTRAFGSYSHQTMLTTAKYDSCNKSIRIKWSPYKGWSKIGSYSVYRKEGGYSYQLIGTTPSDSLAYTDYNIEKNRKYYYFIRALKDTTITVSSSSNSVYIGTDGNVKSYDTYISTVTNKNGAVSVVFLNDPKYYSHIDLYKVVGSTKSFVKRFSGIKTPLINFDNVGEPLKLNSYIVNTYDYCGMASDSSQISGNIVANVTQGENSILLNWNNYFTWNTGVESYQIYRSPSGSKGIYSYAGNANTDTFYNDYITLLNKQEVCYYVLAIQNSGSIYGVDSSVSNSVCIKGKTVVYMPNALNMNSQVNNTFVIKGSNIDLTDIEFSVYNRWGAQIYYTKNLENGWKATDFSGQKLEAGTYYYELSYGENHKEKKSGSVTIIY